MPRVVTDGAGVKAQSIVLPAEPERVENPNFPFLPLPEGRKEKDLFEQVSLHEDFLQRLTAGLRSLREYTEDALKHLAERLRIFMTDVERWSLFVDQTIICGPVPGAYFSFDFHPHQNAETGLSPGAGLAGTHAPFSFKPQFVSVWVEVGDVEIDLLADGDSILANPPLVTTGGVAFLEHDADFSTDMLERLAILTLDVDAVSPELGTFNLHVVLWGRNAGQILPM